MKVKLFGLMLLPAVYFGQVGINTANPQGTFDITAKNATGTSTNTDGILIPRIDRQRAQSMTGVQTSTMVYVNSTATGTQTGTAVNIDATGYYFYNGTVWVKLENPNNAAAGNNIYNGNGTLTNNRTVTQGANTLAFTGTATNAFSVDGTTFSVDASNNRVGIGTSSPNFPLDIRGAGYGFQQSNGTVDIRTWIGTGSGSAVPSAYIGTSSGHPLDLMTGDSSRLRVATNGNVGIGTMNPETRLDITAAAGSNTFGFQHTDGTIKLRSYVGSGSSNGGTRAAWFGTVSKDNLDFMTEDTFRMRLDTSGNFGVGTYTPQRKVHVNGGLQVTGELNVGGSGATAGSAGTAGQVLVSKGADAAPAWENYLVGNTTNVGLYMQATGGSDIVWNNNTGWTTNVPSAIALNESSDPNGVYDPATGIITIKENGIYMFSTVVSLYVSGTNTFDGRYGILKSFMSVAPAGSTTYTNYLAEDNAVVLKGISNATIPTSVNMTIPLHTGDKVRLNFYTTTTNDMSNDPNTIKINKSNSVIRMYKL
ncbi:hypothetical protein [Chryseobacterium phocaeense]|uniref:hypothetical protein n=1 Tax=Chryseobacterium phocaeense TaxID=1816690 RepID=UPI0011184B4F|nr:hypothetical protein [Chryseobacterium phocaeense]